MTPDRHVKASKFLSLVLRHKPETIGLKLDAEGWARVDDLLARLAAHGRRLSRATLEEIVATNRKKRFAFSKDGGRIRASQGHSIAIDLGLEPTDPPPILFHGTGQPFLAAILAGGLNPMQRRHVHLSTDVTTAISVGKRHGVPVVLEVDAAAMTNAGHRFYLSENGVWLTDRVPVEFLTRH